MRQFILLAGLTTLLGGCVGCGNKTAVSPNSPFRAKLDAALAINSSFERDKALVAVANDAAAGADADAVREALEGINSGFTKDSTAAECALKLAKVGKAAEATEIAKKINSSHTRDVTLAKLARGDTGN
jgi:hypothetical protein